MNIPQEERENDKTPLTKEEIHEQNKKREQQAHQHENQNPNLGKDHNPNHHSAGNQ